MTILSRKEYLKYHQELYDMRKKLIGIGDTVIINNHYNRAPIIGKVSHFTSNSKIAVKIQNRYRKDWYYTGYREPDTIIVFKKNRKKCQ